jgi:hypothetical protein
MWYKRAKSFILAQSSVLIRALVLKSNVITMLQNKVHERRFYVTSETEVDPIGEWQ